jgi:predicted RNA-binding protein with RPS1 domain
MYVIGEIIEVTITNITYFGFFIKTKENHEGMCHLTEVSDYYVSNIREYVRLNERIEVQVINYDPQNKNLLVSYKRIRPVLLRGVKVDFSVYAKSFPNTKSNMLKKLEEK